MNYCRECGIITESDNIDLCLACSHDLDAEEREGTLGVPDDEYPEDDDAYDIVPDIDIEEDLLD